LRRIWTRRRACSPASARPCSRARLRRRRRERRAGCATKQPVHDIATAEPKQIPPTRPVNAVSFRSLSRVTYLSGDKTSNGEFKKNPNYEVGYDWLELNGPVRNGFCPYRETEREIFLYDNGRDTYVKLDVPRRKVFVKRGPAGGWAAIHDIAAVERATATAGTCSHLAFRQTADLCHNCTAPPWNGEFNRSAADEWTATFVDGRNRRGTSRWRVTSQFTSEILLYDASRDMYLRVDLDPSTSIVAVFSKRP
jgi:hypothetical protein